MTIKYKCQYCSSIVINNYCNTCEAYFTIRKSIQEYVSVHIDKLDCYTIQDKLCSPCTKYYKRNYIIKCKSFKDYMHKLSLCTKCKIENQKFIKNMFYKSFILSRSIEREVSLVYIFIFIISSFFNVNILYYSIYFSIYYNIFTYRDILVFIVSCVFYNLINFNVLMNGIFDNLPMNRIFNSISRYIVLRNDTFYMLFYIYFVVVFYTKKNVYFKIQNNLENQKSNQEDISRHIEKLSISD